MRWRARLWRFAIAALGIEAVLFLITTRRFAVEGRSMLPALKPGERLAVSIYGYRFRRPRRGELVVVRTPGASGRLDVKRIQDGPGGAVELAGRQVRLGPDEWFLTGDNALESTDSRHYGPVRSRDLVGPVWFKY